MSKHFNGFTSDSLINHFSILFLDRQNRRIPTHFSLPSNNFSTFMLVSSRTCKETWWSMGHKRINTYVSRRMGTINLRNWNTQDRGITVSVYCLIQLANHIVGVLSHRITHLHDMLLCELLNHAKSLGKTLPFSKLYTPDVASMAAFQPAPEVQEVQRHSSVLWSIWWTPLVWLIVHGCTPTNALRHT